MRRENEFDLSVFRPTKIELEEALARANRSEQEQSLDINRLDYSMYVEEN
jgi:hypothetical protein